MFLFSRYFLITSRSTNTHTDSHADWYHHHSLVFREPRLWCSSSFPLLPRARFLGLKAEISLAALWHFWGESYKCKRNLNAIKLFLFLLFFVVSPLTRSHSSGRKRDDDDVKFVFNAEMLCDGCEKFALRSRPSPAGRGKFSIKLERIIFWLFNRLFKIKFQWR